MRVQHNIPSMNSYRNYNNNTSSINKNLEKLSSGYQINRAGDNAAGLAISEKMRAQITGLEVAQKNAKDGISLVQTAEGALTEVHSMLNRMYELAEQSANGTYSDDVDRVQLQKEVDSLKTEINRIADSANFNGTKLLDGSLSAGGAGSVEAQLTDTTNFASITLGDAGADGDDIQYEVADDGNSSSATAKITVGSTEYTASITSSIQDGDTVTFSNSDGSDSIDVVFTTAGLSDAKGVIGGTDISAASIGAVGQPSSVSAKLSDTTNVEEITLGSNGAKGDDIKFEVESEESGSAATVRVTVGDTVYEASTDGTSDTLTLNEAGGGTDSITVKLSADGLTALGAAVSATDDSANVAEASVGSVDGAAGAGNTLTLQIGDDSSSWNQMQVSIDDIHVKSLGKYTSVAASGTTPAYKTPDGSSGDASAPTSIEDIDISNSADAMAALDVIKEAINYVSDTRGGLGAIQNRLEHTINNLSVMQENMQDAESTIRDTDVASEMMKYTKNSILVQSAQAMLAQANQQPQGVLQLLQ